MADPAPPTDDVSALVTRLLKLEGRVRDLETPSGTQRVQAVSQLEEAVADLATQQATLAGQVSFLQTQTAYDSKGTSTSYTGSNTGITWQAFNSTWDAAVNVTTSGSGLLVISMSAQLVGGGFSALLAAEIVGAYGPVYPGPFSAVVSDGGAATARTTVATLTPNTAYTVRLRRGIDGTASGAVIWGYQALAVTRIL